MEHLPSEPEENKQNAVYNPDDKHDVGNHNNNNKQPAVGNQIHDVNPAPAKASSCCTSFLLVGIVGIVVVSVGFYAWMAWNNRYTAFDTSVFKNISPKDIAEKKREFEEVKKEEKVAGIMNNLYEGFSSLMTWKDKTEAEKAAADIKPIEDKIFLINFKKLKTKGNCQVFNGIHVDHYPTVIRNLAKMLNLPEEKERNLLYAVNAKEDFEEHFDSFDAENKDGEQLFGRFAVKRIKPEWISMMYSIQSIQFKLSSKEDQRNADNITDLINYNNDGEVDLTFKAKQYFTKYYTYEAQVHFEKKCKFLLPKSSDPKKPEL